MPIGSDTMHKISIHAPCTGSDENLLHTVRDYIISIHAPCTGSDATAARKPGLHTNFNPRSLHGERRCSGAGSIQNSLFQSTLPARGATGSPGGMRGRGGISIHAPCTGSDLCRLSCLLKLLNFNPRSLHGERPATDAATLGALLFQSTLPARGATNSRVC